MAKQTRSNRGVDEQVKVGSYRINTMGDNQKRNTKPTNKKFIKFPEQSSKKVKQEVIQLVTSRIKNKANK